MQLASALQGAIGDAMEATISVPPIGVNHETLAIKCASDQALTLPETEEAMLLEILMAEALKLPLLIIVPS